MKDNLKNINWRLMSDWIRAVFWSALFVFFFTGYVFKGYRIDGSSMNPLLHHGEFVLTERLSPVWYGYHRSEIVVFDNPAEPNIRLIKRILAVPGDYVEIRSGEVYLNGTRLSESYVAPEFRSHETMRPLRVPKGFYFVAGDHRNNSNDSRLWAFSSDIYPFVPEKCLEGRVLFRFWPLSALSRID